MLNGSLKIFLQLHIWSKVSQDTSQGSEWLGSSLTGECFHRVLGCKDYRQELYILEPVIKAHLPMIPQEKAIRVIISVVCRDDSCGYFRTLGSWEPTSSLTTTCVRVVNGTSM